MKQVIMNTQVVIPKYVYVSHLYHCILPEEHGFGDSLLLLLPCWNEILIVQMSYYTCNVCGTLF